MLLACYDDVCPRFTHCCWPSTAVDSNDVGRGLLQCLLPTRRLRRAVHQLQPAAVCDSVCVAASAEPLCIAISSHRHRLQDHVTEYVSRENGALAGALAGWLNWWFRLLVVTLVLMPCCARQALVRRRTPVPP